MYVIIDDCLFLNGKSLKKGQDGHVGGGGAHLDSVAINESLWEDVFPLLDAHFLSLVPCHLYEEFLDNVLCALEVAGHYDSNGKNLMQYVFLYFIF